MVGFQPLKKQARNVVSLDRGNRKNYKANNINFFQNIEGISGKQVCGARSLDWHYLFKTITE